MDYMHCTTPPQPPPTEELSVGKFWQHRFCMTQQSRL